MRIVENTSAYSDGISKNQKFKKCFKLFFKNKTRKQLFALVQYVIIFDVTKSHFSC